MRRRSPSTLPVGAPRGRRLQSRRQVDELYLIALDQQGGLPAEARRRSDRRGPPSQQDVDGLG